MSDTRDRLALARATAKLFLTPIVLAGVLTLCPSVSSAGNKVLPPDAGATLASSHGTRSRGPLPIAETGKAILVSFGAASVSGRVNARNQPTLYKFQYGHTLPYAHTTETSEGYVVGHRAEIVSEALSPLKPATKYHFRIIAFNKFGFVTGRDRTFTTKRR